MLALESPRWAELTTFFGSPEDVPVILGEWLNAIGSDRELGVYYDRLFDVLLHQATITNAAFAIVPWIVDVCARGVTKNSGEYLADVALVEANRLESGVYFTRPGTAPLPDWLMGDYSQAIAIARGLAEDALAGPLDDSVRQGLIWLKPALYGNAKLAWKQYFGEDAE